MKTITLTNYRGKKVRLPANATLGELLKRGITFAGLYPKGEPRPKSRRIFTG